MKSKTKDPEKVKQGKKNLAAGRRFEAKVRDDLEKKGWTVSKWQNNVDLNADASKYTCLIPAKQGPYRRTSTGFPDFVCMQKVHEEFKVVDMFNQSQTMPLYLVQAIEVKSNGQLKPEEKDKCQWLLSNGVFSKIYIAKKGKKRGTIEYKEFIVK